MADIVRVRAVLTQVFSWLIFTVKVFPNNPNIPLDSNSQESTLPITVVPTLAIQNSSRSGLFVLIGAAISQVYHRLISIVKVFWNYLNVFSPFQHHNRPQALDLQGQGQSEQHQINIPPNPNSHYSNQVHVPQASNGMNSISLIFQSKELSEAVLGLVVPITDMLLDESDGLTFFQSGFITIALYLGFAAVFNGMLLKGVFPRAASVMEKLGVALIFLGLYGLISSSLPPALEWVSWLCYALSCVPIVSSFLPLNSTGEITHLNSNSQLPPV